MVISEPASAYLIKLALSSEKTKCRSLGKAMERANFPSFPFTVHSKPWLFRKLCISSSSSAMVERAFFNVGRSSFFIRRSRSRTSPIALRASSAMAVEFSATFGLVSRRPSVSERMTTEVNVVATESCSVVISACRYSWFLCSAASLRWRAFFSQTPKMIPSKLIADTRTKLKRSSEVQMPCAGSIMERSTSTSPGITA